MVMCQDELFEVFSYLPAKAIYRFKCMSKSVSKLPKETCFAMKQAENSLKKDDTCFFLQQETSQRYNKKVKLYPLPGKQSSSGVSEDVLRFLSKSTRVLASTKGLILCRTTSKTPDELFVCNPATKSWLPIPSPKQVQEKPDADLIMVLLECSNSCDDYMVLHFEGPTDWSSNYACKFYKPKEGLWKAMEKSFFVGGRNMKFNMPVYYNGAIHFISNCSPYLTKRSPYFRPYVMSYNLENGTSTMLRLPKDARRGSHDLNCEMSIFSWGKVSTPQSSICLVRLRKSVFTIWILTNYESKRWMRILKVRTKGMGLREKDPKITGFTVMNGGLLIFATETRVYSYGLTDENYMRVEEICQHRCKSNVCFTSYSDTLRLCGLGAASLPC
ncbi:F-box protein [Spatholobus suberectus]|nr:F-box protein [Spatholobus suberectus]